MSATFKTIGRKTPYILLLSMDEWLPEDHLAHFIVEVVSMLDLEPIRAAYSGRGSETLDPNVELCDRKDITPFISFGRQQHNLALEDRWHLPLDPETEDPLALMKHRLKTPEGRKLYGQRKATIEPAFGGYKAGDGLPPVPASWPSGR